MTRAPTSLTQAGRLGFVISLALAMAAVPRVNPHAAESAIEQRVSGDQPAAWNPALPDGAVPLYEFVDQTVPVTVPRGSDRETTGGVLGTFDVDGLGIDQTILKTFPLALRVDSVGHLIVEDGKRGTVLTHPGPVQAGVSHECQVHCGPQKWILILDGDQQTFEASGLPICFSETWGDVTVGASNSSGSGRFSGTVDLTIYLGGSMSSDSSDEDDNASPGRVVFLTDSGLTAPKSYPDGDWVAPVGSGGLDVTYVPDAVGDRVVFFHAWPLMMEMTAGGELRVLWKKSNRPLAIGLDANPRVGRSLSARWRCEGSEWRLEVDGKSTRLDTGGGAPCVDDTRARPVVVGSTQTGTSAISGILSFTWYADGSGDSDDDDSDDQHGELVFVGDFETGDISQWPIHAFRAQNTYSVQVLSPGRNGDYACRFEVRYLDRGYDEDGNPKKVRAELGEPSVEMGSTWWYGWSSRIDPDYRAEARTFYMVQQWHLQAKLPPFGQYYENGIWKIYRNVGSDGRHGVILWQEPVPKGQWVDWVYQVKWTYENDGFLKAYKDGELVVDYRGPTTVEVRKGPWFKFGMYRGAPDLHTQIAWHDEYRRGTTRAAVDPRNYE